MNDILTKLLIEKDGIVGEWHEWVSIIISIFMISYFLVYGISINIIMSIPFGILIGSHLYSLDRTANQGEL